MPNVMPQQQDENDMSFPLSFDSSTPDDTPPDDTVDGEVMDNIPTTSPDEMPGRASLSSRFGEAYKMASEMPTGPNNKAYSNFLEHGAPNRADYKPGKLNRLAAILGGASEGYRKGPGAGANFADSMLDKPYNEALASNEMQGRRLAAGATLEDKEMGRKASFARTAATDIHNTNMEDTARKNAASLDIVRKAQAHKAMNPNAVYKNINGKVVAIGADGKQTILGDATMLSPEAFKQHKDLAKFTSDLIAGRETTLESIRNKNATVRQDDAQAHAETMAEITARHAKELDDYKKAHPEQSTSTTTTDIDPTGTHRVSTTTKGGNKGTGTIKVKRKSDGMPGTIPAASYDPAKYDKVQ